MNKLDWSIEDDKRLEWAQILLGRRIAIRSALSYLVTGTHKEQLQKEINDIYSIRQSLCKLDRSEIETLINDQADKYNQDRSNLDHIEV